MARTTRIFLRNELHYSISRRDDRLTFDNWRKLAQELHYQDDLGVDLRQAKQWLGRQS